MSPAEVRAVENLTPLKPGDKLETGRTYYAKILLTGMEALFGKATDVAEKLSAAGIKGVLVSTSPIDDVPDREKFPSGSTFWARGVWGAGDKQLGGGALPTQVKALWRSEAPALDADKVKALAPAPGPAAKSGPTLKELLLVGGAIYLLRKGRGRRLLARFAR
jgi:hypothetical protein